MKHISNLYLLNVVFDNGRRWDIWIEAVSIDWCFTWINQNPKEGEQIPVDISIKLLKNGYGLITSQARGIDIPI